MEVLIKAMVQAIPAYPMNLFKFPETICKELDSLLSNFWWGHATRERHIHWVSQDILKLPKAQGGMGFISFMDFNDGLLAKQFWRLLQEPQSLWARVLKVHYFPSCFF